MTHQQIRAINAILARNNVGGGERDAFRNAIRDTSPLNEIEAALVNETQLAAADAPRVALDIFNELNPVAQGAPGNPNNGGNGMTGNNGNGQNGGAIINNNGVQPGQGSVPVTFNPVQIDLAPVGTGGQPVRTAAPAAPVHNPAPAQQQNSSAGIWPWLALIALLVLGGFLAWWGISSHNDKLDGLEANQQTLITGQGNLQTGQNQLMDGHVDAAAERAADKRDLMAELDKAKRDRADHARDAKDDRNNKAREAKDDRRDKAHDAQHDRDAKHLTNVQLHAETKEEARKAKWNAWRANRPRNTRTTRRIPGNMPR